MKLRHYLLIALSAFVPIAACDSAPQTSFRQVTVSEARSLVSGASENDILVVDVRTPDEFRAGHLPGAANINVRAQDFELQMGKIDRDQEVLVYCRSGARSAQAVSIMKDMGFTNILEMSSGWQGWSEGMGSDQK